MNPHRGFVSTSNGILALVVDQAVRNDVDRVVAAVGARVVHVTQPSSPKVWGAASAVLLDVEGAARCAQAGLPRRGRVFVVSGTEPAATDWPLLIAVGAQRILTLPAEEVDLVSALSEAAESAREPQRRGAVLAVIGARGGAGASVFATAIAHAATRPLLVDLDPWGGGIELVVGCEGESGLRWSELALQGGRVGWPALQAALPAHRGIAVLSAGREGAHVDAAALDAVVDAGARGGATVICDLPRRATPAVEMALASADLVAIVTPADVRSCAAATAIGGWLVTANANVGLVIRGPAPGGLTAAEVERAIGLPRLASMRAQPGITVALERDGLNPRRRSPLTKAADRVLAVLHQVPGERSFA
jgi:secretion/DNA translocation related CpaE-like protein